VTTGRLIPFCLFTDPELARVGLSEREAKERGIRYRLFKIPMMAVLRARISSVRASDSKPAKPKRVDSGPARGGGLGPPEPPYTSWDWDHTSYASVYVALTPSLLKQRERRFTGAMPWGKLFHFVHIVQGRRDP